MRIRCASAVQLTIQVSQHETTSIELSKKLINIGRTEKVFTGTIINTGHFKASDDKGGARKNILFNSKTITYLS